ncbi:hypothetical protein RR46_00115 [Papilio xuthus]|uniref:Uncharacterized protein n=1 Tax=Papilio xuthus TaxID=66420 RepID=A0A0N0PF00_PAPXU|nr:hypothetical protein RR46_00115 [Papilio xuthus]
MAPVELHGNTLGERHKNFNKLVKESNQHSLNIDEANINESDISNLLNIDVANTNKNVEYILKTLTCSDLLYVTRALKNCDWLINDEKYTHIINPEYLNVNLYPKMQTKAVLKLQHLIQLKLRDELRAEQFFKYETKSSAAVKWLPKCSIEFIENNFSKYKNEIKIPILRRLCEKSIIFLEKYADGKLRPNVSQSTLFLLNVNLDKYLDILESQSIFSLPIFGKRATKLLMTKCPQRIIDKFYHYCYNIDGPTFIKYLNEDLETFLKKNFNEDKDHDLNQYFSKVKHWEPFLCALPESRRIEFINKFFISETKEIEATIKLIRELLYRTPFYYWYKFFPFELAFSTIKSMMGPETDEESKIEMLETIMLSAKGDLEHGKCLLKYFQDKHINSPRKVRVTFLVNFISNFKTHNLDEDSWNMLQNIMESLDIYNDENIDKTIIESLMVYQILNGKNVPEKTSKLFTFNSLKSFQTKLNSKEKEIIFKNLSETNWKEVQSIELNEIDDFIRCINSLNNTLILLKDWNKNILDYPFVLEKIKELVKIKQEKDWNGDMSPLYNVQKSWRKHMFNESIILSPTEEVCINSLKHDPNLLDLYKNEVESIFSNNNVSLKRLLRKVRIYWPESINKDFKNAYLNRLNQNDGKNAITQGLCILLPKEELTMILNKHAPINPKVDFDKIDEIELDLQRCLAKNMHNARPHPNFETLFLYAKGDYLMFAMSSVRAIYYNVSSVQCQESVSQILNTPVSLQKHGLRLLFNKLPCEKIKESCYTLWKESKNPTIRTEIFKLVFKLLCNEKIELNITQTWELLEMLIDDLTFLENKSIYRLMYEVNKIPLSVKAKFLVKSYNYLKTLIKNNKQEYEGERWDLRPLVMYSKRIVSSMPYEFMTEIIDDYVKNEFFKERIKPGDKTELISSFILCSRSEEEQMKKYNEVLAPILMKSIKLCNEQIESKYYIKENIELLLINLNDDLHCIIRKKFIPPVKMFTVIQEILEQLLPLSENYILIRTWQLTTNLVTLFYKYQPQIWDDTCTKIAPEVGKICKEYLMKDTKSYSPRIYTLFMKAFANVFRLFSDDVIYEIFKSFIEKEDFLVGYLAALQGIKLLSEHAIIKDMHENISKHPSVEVKMHYYNTFRKGQIDEPLSLKSWD